MANNTSNMIDVHYTITVIDGLDTLKHSNHIIDLEASAITTSSCDEPDPNYTIPLGSETVVQDISLSMEY